MAVARRATPASVPGGAPLGAEHFRPVAIGGFGEPENATAHSMAWFRGRLYVGTTRHKIKEPKAVRRQAKLPGADQRAQIWRYDPEADRWDMVFRSPLLLMRDGRHVPRDSGYRGILVFQGRNDPEPALYVTTISTFGGLILRSADGEKFTPVCEPGFGNPRTRSFRALVEFDGRLYTSPAGVTGTELIERNSTEEPVVLESDDPTSGKWRSVSALGIGDPTNRCIFEMASFNGYLYAGTGNFHTGFQIWKTKATGASYEWKRVLSEGAFRGKSNQSAVSMVPFRGALYIGGGIQGFGYDKAHDAGPAAAEIVRLHPDDSWDLIVGDERATFDGKKKPLSGRGPGFDNFYNSIIWRMVEHDGWLYAGTHDWSVRLAHLMPLAPVRPRLGKEFREVIAREAGFDVWRSNDGARWTPVTRVGFGHPYSYGVRTFCSAPAGLFIGTVTTPDTIKGLGGDPAEHRGGCEIWLGRSGR